MPQSPPRLSPGAFLMTLRRRPQLVDDDQEQSCAVEMPRDCVRKFPTLNPDTAELVAFDADGVPQVKMELPAEDADHWWPRLLLRYVRWRFRRRQIKLVD
jgi:hypothetical protein